MAATVSDWAWQTLRPQYPYMAGNFQSALNLVRMLVDSQQPAVRGMYDVNQVNQQLTVN